LGERPDLNGVPRARVRKYVDGDLGVLQSQLNHVAGGTDRSVGLGQASGKQRFHKTLMQPMLRAIKANQVSTGFKGAYVEDSA